MLSIGSSTVTTERIQQSAAMAAEWHKDQVRKYTGEPYTEHLREVAAIVRSVPYTEDMVCAAWLHDILEDTGCPGWKVEANFGPAVYHLVWLLSDLMPHSVGNRAYRKGLYRQKLAMFGPEAHTIKLADLISNARSIFKQDPGFASVYAGEMGDLLRVLTKGDHHLRAQALRILNEYYSYGTGP